MTTAGIDFRAVKDHASFAEILHRCGVTLSGSGAQRMVLCPFHDDHEPSCSVHLEEKVFHCFACLAEGDILDFVAKIENVPLREAAEIIASSCGTSLPTHNTPRPTVPSPKKADGENAPLGFELQLNTEHPYFQKRGVWPEVVKTFGLGFCDRGIMRGRICIPIRDTDGELVAYAGRWAKGDTPPGVPKYLLPRGFKKSEVLFNLHRVASADHVMLVEGYWAVFRLHALGIPAVALMGRTLSSAQEELLACSSARFLTLLLDGDEPGRMAAQALLPRATRNWFVYHSELPDGQQPDTVDEKELRRVLWTLISLR